MKKPLYFFILIAFCALFLIKTNVGAVVYYNDGSGSMAQQVSCNYNGTFVSSACNKCSREGYSGDASIYGPVIPGSCVRNPIGGGYCQDFCYGDALYSQGSDYRTYICGGDAASPDVQCRYTSEPATCEVITTGNGPYYGAVSSPYLCPSNTGGSSAPDFSIFVSPSVNIRVQGASATYNVTVTSLSHFAGTVNLSYLANSGACPANATCTFTPASLAIADGGSGVSTFTVSNTNTTPLATYSMKLTGTSGSLSHYTDAFLVMGLGTNDSSCSMTGVLDSMAPGQQFSPTITMTNTGTKSWTSGGANPYRLYSVGSSAWGNVTSPQNLPSPTIAAGSPATFNMINVTAPAAPGTYTFNWRMAEGAVAQFGATCLKTVTVTSNPPGACGTGSGQSFPDPWTPSPSNATLCSYGNPSVPAKAGSNWNWTCTGSSGSPAQCSAIINTTANGSCGSANGQSFPTAPSGNLCSVGTNSPVTQSGSNWTWNCNGISGGSPASCSATVNTVTVVNGACGSANGQTFATSPTTNLCSTGTPTAVSSGANWTWNCNGANGGASPSCSANKVSADLRCSSSAGGPYTNGPCSVSYGSNGFMQITSSANSCTVSYGATTISNATSGNINHGPITGTRTYTLSCDGGAATDSVTFNLLDSATCQTSSCVFNPSSVGVGGQTDYTITPASGYACSTLTPAPNYSTINGPNYAGDVITGRVAPNTGGMYSVCTNKTNPADSCSVNCSLNLGNFYFDSISPSNGVVIPGNTVGVIKRNQSITLDTWLHVDGSWGSQPINVSPKLPLPSGWTITPSTQKYYPAATGNQGPTFTLTFANNADNGWIIGGDNGSKFIEFTAEANSVNRDRGQLFYDSQLDLSCNNVGQKNCTINAGQTVTLRWNLMVPFGINTANCSITGSPAPTTPNWSYNNPPGGATSGSTPTGAINANTSYTMTCSTNIGNISDSVNVTVTGGGGGTPNASADLRPDDSVVPYGGSTTLRWTYSDATDCNLTPAIVAIPVPPFAGTGSVSTGPLTFDKPYTLTCNPGGTQSHANVSVQNATSPTLNVIKSGQGIVTGSSSHPSGIVQTNINCPASCSGQSQVYELNTTVTLTASIIPGSGRRFTGWSGGWCSGTGNCVVNLNSPSDRTVIANFAVNPDFREF